jgi:cell division protease FtsH
MDKKDEKSKKPDQSGADGEGHTPPPMRGILAWLLVLGLILLMFQLYATRQAAHKLIKFTPDFSQLVEDGRVDRCELIQEASGRSYILAELKTDPDNPEAQPKKVRIVAPIGDKLTEYLSTNQVDYTHEYKDDYFKQLVAGILPVLLIFGLLYYLITRQMRNATGGAMGFGKSRAKMLNREKQKTTFKNVAGIDEAQEEVEEIIDFLKDPKRFQALGGRIPKGVLLMGPPGTGKTLLAKAIAGEADVPFFSISGSDFVEMFVGVGASRVRDMFEQGKKSAPCIIFIDEIDAVGRSRFTGIGGGHDEREQTLNALLVEMDGFDTQEGVIILAATNRPDVLDQALLRPGRFDRQIVIDLPTIDGREEILNIHSKRITLATVADLRRVARGTPGFSGADLENLLNEAALLAAREDKKAVELEDLEEARDKVKWGRERRSRKMDNEEKRLTAYHEAGHALVQQVVEHSEPLHKVTIIPRGMYLGATMSLPDKDRYTETKTKLLDELAVFMGGRVAEEEEFADITNGARSDLHVATQIARHMVCDWGMSETLGPQTFGDNEQLMFMGRGVSNKQDYSEETAKKIDAEVNAVLRDSQSRARIIITGNRKKLDMIAERLLVEETIDGRDVEEIVEHGRVLSAEERKDIDKKKKEEDEAKEAAEKKKTDEAKKKVETKKDAAPKPPKLEKPKPYTGPEPLEIPEVGKES